MRNHVPSTDLLEVGVDPASAAVVGVVVAMCVIGHMDKLQGRAQFLETATACGINDRYHPCCSDFTSSKLIRLSACACLYAAFMQLNYMDVNVGE